MAGFIICLYIRTTSYDQGRTDEGNGLKIYGLKQQPEHTLNIYYASCSVTLNNMVGAQMGLEPDGVFSVTFF